MTTEYTSKRYMTDEEGNELFLLHTASSPYGMIVMKIGDNFYDGLRQPLPPETRAWCNKNIGK